MSIHVMTDCDIFLDENDLTAQSNKVELKYSADALPVTTFNDTTKIRQAGLKNIEANIEGLWQADTGYIDTIAGANIGVVGKILTICPDGSDQGEVCFSFKNMLSEYNCGAQVGEILPFTYTGSGSDAQGLIKGTVMEKAAKTSTANGTARQLGAVAAGQYLYAGIHVLAVSGTNPTLDVTIQTDNASNFPSALTKITFPQMTAVGSQWGTRVAGPLTDDWYRVAWTIGGSNTPSFTILVWVAIQ